MKEVTTWRKATEDLAKAFCKHLTETINNINGE